jgi:PAS domain-containing protein
MSSISAERDPIRRLALVASALAGIATCVAIAIVAPSARMPLVAVAGMAVGMATTLAWMPGRDRRGPVTDDRRHLTEPSFRHLLALCEEALVVTDGSLRILYANQAFAAVCGGSSDAVKGTTLVDALAQRITDDVDFVRTTTELIMHPEREASGEITRVAPSARSFEWRSVPLREGV